MKKKIGIALLAIIMVSSLVFAVDNCKYYSTNPGGIYLRGLSANLSERTIRVESSIKEPVKITLIKVGTNFTAASNNNDLIWQVTGVLRLEPMGSTMLTIPASVRLNGTTVLIQAESCD